MDASTVSAECFDVVVIGAGISGIGAACYLTNEFPSKKIAVLEGRDNIGGTWDLFRYPGIRSDSDLHTYGYEFKPWRHESAIADGHLIRDYLRETVEEYGLERLIRLRHEVVSADWSSDEALWTLTVRTTDGSGAVTELAMKARWVYGATGYYRYDEGYTPHFEGRDEFTGDILHPQHWPENYDYSGKKVVVIGSGATAVTLLPAMTVGPGAAAHVTMLQRTPSYIMEMPRVDALSLQLTKLFGPERGYALTRRKNIWRDQTFVKFVQTFPRAGRALIRHYTKKALPADFDVDTHFNPPYEPWDQRLCATPDGDFFKAISDGRASVVTDRVARFTKNGILLTSGRELKADVIVTATGLNMRFFGGVRQSVDGKPVVLADTVTYRGMLLSGVPNWVVALGYTKSSSWTLKVGLTSRYICDLIKHMDAHGHEIAVPVPDAGMPTRPLLDLTAGYVTRSMDTLPRQGTGLPWRMLTSYRQDAKLLKGALFDRHLRFSARNSAPVRSEGGKPQTTTSHRRGATR
ncbi:flavin-containing monooxygenase [Streptomyces sp. NPDC101160]|uniref:flavin-containing monooxygenase n=1 Tax=Streptomyces sp. NPDC101160 TaxID=3366118 RepID=UPI00381B71F5